ncbi:HelD family protein [Paenibacillus chartarius]|uniref:DNA 3'-5' helicase n=1 Tax=Paenibacillus chartarius TaxID=747481 RepID=A0ABV6DVN7_9BACL
METKLQSAYQEELQRLEETSRQIDAQLKRLQAIPPYRGDDLTEQSLEAVRESGRRNMARAIEEPYFGRLDFQENGQSAPATLYIGKVGVDDPDTSKLLVIDWRAPVASLFYSFTGGLEQAEYESPEGLVAGLVYLKRNIVIRKQILQRVVDTYDRSAGDPAVTDEFLLYRLGENKDNKLRDIVSTIQAEQDRIIRAAKNTALIIQGVAGSGKTTVALHRLAFLLYQYRDQVHAEKMMIFAPSRMFLDYISGVLPELGVGSIQQSTFADWALDLLDHEVKLADPAERLAAWFAVGPERPPIDDTAPGRWKGSVRFVQLLEDCLRKYEAGALPDTDFEPWERKKLPADTIRGWWDVENKHYPLMKRRERVIARMKRWLEMELDKVWEASRRKELKKSAAQKLRAYEKAWTALTPFGFYKALFDVKQPPFYATKELCAALPESLASASAAQFKKKLVQPEDLAPLVYIRDTFWGISGEHMFDHTVIDEAQDFSPFQVELLRRHTKNDSFSILGDLSQGIHGYQGIHAWDEFSSLFETERTGYFELERSYRSTMEIIHFANHVLQAGVPNAKLAVPVFRSGEPIRILRAASPKQAAAAAVAAVERIRGGSAQAIAVITRTEKASAPVYKALQQAGIEAHLIGAAQQHYGGGVSVVPAYLAKGLEFDAVILFGVDADAYEATPQDAKLLYVGCTRALHELVLIHGADPSPLLAQIPSELIQIQEAGA